MKLPVGHEAAYPANSSKTAPTTKSPSNKDPPMAKSHRIHHTPYRVVPGTRVQLSEFSTKAGDEFKKKSQARQALEEDVTALAEMQRLLWASGEFSMLIILQAMDAAGKDGTIRHVMSGVNPQGCSVTSFKAPTEEELGHHFLWRPTRYLPAKGRIGIFNRSYYEEVLIVRVHPEFLEPQRLPKLPPGGDLWRTRFDDINHFEHSLVRNGTSVIKFYLHLSKDEQKRRFLDRLNEPDKHWKFNEADVHERSFWGDYQHAYEDMLSETSTAWAPWHIVPADDKWFARALVADVIATKISELDMQYPTVSDEDREKLAGARKELEGEQ